MSTLTIEVGGLPGIQHQSKKGERIRALQVYGRRLARKILRRIGTGKVRGVGGIEDAPHLGTIDEKLIDVNVAGDIAKIIEMKCMLLLEDFGPEEVVRNAILERWGDIMLTLQDNHSVGEEVRVAETAINPHFSRIIHQIISRIRSQANPIRHPIRNPHLLPSPS